MKILKFLAMVLIATIIAAGLLFSEGDIPKDVVDARYSSPGSQFLELQQQGRIHYRDEGSRRSLPIILIHGSNASLHTFEPWVRLLSDRYRIITIDMPGHGLTGEIPSNDYSTQTMLSVIDAVTDHLGLQRFIIGGNSMGGALAWRYALAHDEKVSGLVLINAAGAPITELDQSNDEASTSAVWAFNLVGKPWFATIAGKLDPYYLVAQGLRTAYNHSPVVNQALIMRYNDMLLREGSRLATIRRFSQGYDRSTPDFSLLTMPTLIMWGKQDALIPFSHAAAFESVIPHAITAYYDGAGHIPMEEIPARSAEDLADFLTTLAP